MTTKTQKSTTATIFPEAGTCEPYSTFKHILWEPNTQGSLDNSLRTDNERNAKTHYTYL